MERGEETGVRGAMAWLKFFTPAGKGDVNGCGGGWGRGVKPGGGEVRGRRWAGELDL
jgi:hypothetical protein